MKRMCAGWWAALVLMLAASAGAARAQTLPPTEPIPRIETGMHTARIARIGIDACANRSDAGERKQRPQGTVGTVRTVQLFASRLVRSEPSCSLLRQLEVGRLINAALVSNG